MKHPIRVFICSCCLITGSLPPPPPMTVSFTNRKENCMDLSIALVCTTWQKCDRPSLTCTSCILRWQTQPRRSRRTRKLWQTSAPSARRTAKNEKSLTPPQISSSSPSTLYPFILPFIFIPFQNLFLFVFLTFTTYYPNDDNRRPRPRWQHFQRYNPHNVFTSFRISVLFHS